MGRWRKYEKQMLKYHGAKFNLKKKTNLYLKGNVQDWECKLQRNANNSYSTA